MATHGNEMGRADHRAGWWCDKRDVVAGARMKKVPLKFIVTLICLACHVSVGRAAESALCPGHEVLVVSRDVFVSCERDMPKSMDDCTKLVQELSNLETRTTQQKYDLASAMRELSKYTEHAKKPELRDRAAELYGSLNKELPNDISVLFDRYLLTEEEESVAFLFLILRIAPECNAVRIRLLEDLGYHLGYEDDPNLSLDWQGVIRYQLSAGYDQSVEKKWKLQFGKMMFNSSLHAGRWEQAKRLQKSIFDELDIANLSYDDASRKENLEAICDDASFRLRFTKHCLDGIDRSLEQDVKAGRALGEDVVRAIKNLADALTSGSGDRAVDEDEFVHPASVKFGNLRDIPLYPQEAARYAIRLDDMVRGVPVELQSLELYRAAQDVIGRNSQLKMLERLLLVDSNNAEIQDRISQLRSH